MSFSLRVVLSSSLSLCCLLACTKADDTAEESGSESAETSSSSSASGSESGGGSETSSETGSGELIPCGDFDCPADQVCLTFPQEPMCEDKPMDQPCPPGTTETQCGGAGLPCCCGETPPAMTDCVDPGCEGPVDCTCLAEICVPMCVETGTPGVFICETPPPP